MNTPARAAVGLLCLAILVGGGISLMHAGWYGLAIFMILPVLLGGLASWVFRPATRGEALRLGAVAAFGASGFFLLLGLEGIICIAMAVPLAAPLSALGSWLVFRAGESDGAATGLMMLLLLPPGVLWDAHAVPPVFEVRTAIEVAASPEQIWKNVLTLSELPPPQEWYFRAGLAYPTLARLEGSGVGAMRYCEFSTGKVVERIDAWDEARRLRFRVLTSPPPMHEWNPFVRVSPRHLHGYLLSREGEFRLTPLPNGRTLLEGTSWYSHGLWPAAYWRVWSDAIIHRVHLRVLNRIRVLSEQKTPW